MIQILIDNPLLLLFLVSALGYLLGQVRFFGTSLGIAAVLFVGLFFGALDPALKLPEIIYLLGLVLFVYTVGLSSGAGFFASLRRDGLRYNIFGLSMLLFAAGLVVAIYYALRLTPAVSAGLFAGALTNTPALASVLDGIRTSSAPEVVERLINQPVVGYSIAYPVGFIGMIIAISVAQRTWRVDPVRETETLRAFGMSGDRLLNHTIEVTRPEAEGRSARDLLAATQADVVIGRVKRGEEMTLASGDTTLAVGDLVSVIGSEESIAAFEAALGQRSTVELPLDRTEFDYRRIFVSNPDVVGIPLRRLDVRARVDAMITRVRRGDMDLLPHGDTVLELGDRVRVLTRRERLDEVTRFFGDSYRSLSEIDILSFTLGLALGLLVGLIPIPLPGGVTLKLGNAGGPLVVSLILGALRRTGPIVWILPYSANLTLRQVGLVMFLAGVGTRSGYAFVQTLTGGGGLILFAAGAVVTLSMAGLTLVVGYKLLKIPTGLLMGILSGIQTNPGVLAYAQQEAKNDLPAIGYATVYPMATIAKIILAQLILVSLR